jgi:hypothetical protein
MRICEARRTAEERLAMMWPLALGAWSLTEELLPECDRSRYVVRKSSLGEE